MQRQNSLILLEIQTESGLTKRSKMKKQQSKSRSKRRSSNKKENNTKEQIVEEQNQHPSPKSLNQELSKSHHHQGALNEVSSIPDLVDTTTSTNATTNSTSRVRFTAEIVEHGIMTREEYTEAEVEESWWTYEERKRLNKKHNKVVDRLEEGKKEKRSSPYRGLEKIAIQGYRDMILARNKYVDAVMDEQEKQWLAGHEWLDWEHIASLVVDVCTTSTKEALEMAKQDRQQAQEAYEASTSSSTTTTSATTSATSATTTSSNTTSDATSVATALSEQDTASADEDLIEDDDDDQGSSTSYDDKLHQRCRSSLPLIHDKKSNNSTKKKKKKKRQRRKRKQQIDVVKKPEDPPGRLLTSTESRICNSIPTAAA